MKLHEAIEKLILEENRPLSTSEIAEKLNLNKWYQKKDKSLITDFQIHGRTKNYSNIFQRNGSLVSLHNLNFQELKTEKKSLQNFYFFILLFAIIIIIICNNVS